MKVKVKKKLLTQYYKLRSGLAQRSQGHGVGRQWAAGEHGGEEREDPSGPVSSRQSAVYSSSCGSRVGLSSAPQTTTLDTKAWLDIPEMEESIPSAALRHASFEPLAKTGELNKFLYSKYKSWGLHFVPKSHGDAHFCLRNMYVIYNCQSHS